MSVLDMPLTDQARFLELTKTSVNEGKYQGKKSMLVQGVQDFKFDDFV